MAPLDHLVLHQILIAPSNIDQCRSLWLANFNDENLDIPDPQQPACQQGSVIANLTESKKSDIFLTRRRFQSLKLLQSQKGVRDFDIVDFEASSRGHPVKTREDNGGGCYGVYSTLSCISVFARSKRAKCPIDSPHPVKVATILGAQWWAARDSG